MSDPIVLDPEPETIEAPAVGSSLEARLAQRRDEIERNVAEVFPVPGWEDFFAVRLRKVSGKRLGKVAERHKSIRDEYLRTLYTAADQIILGTDGFYDLADHDGELPDPDTPTLEGFSWQRAALAADNRLSADITPRQALLSLITPDGADQRLSKLVREWADWMESGRGPVDRRLQQDFRATR